MSQTTKSYQSLEEIIALVQSLESCEIEPAAFNHRAHLTVALWYLSQSSCFEEAANKMRVGLLRFLSHNKLHGYNETITLFWLKVLKCFLDRRKDGNGFVELTNESVEFYSDSKIIFRHYSRERLMSDEAKANWIEPDLKPMTD
jgi:hypothetical protein